MKMQCSRSNMFFNSSRISTATGGSILSRSSIKKVNPALLGLFLSDSSTNFEISSFNCKISL